MGAGSSDTRADHVGPSTSLLNWLLHHCAVIRDHNLSRVCVQLVIPVPFSPFSDSDPLQTMNSGSILRVGALSQKLWSHNLR
jgi:hypothetical protein